MKGASTDGHSDGPARLDLELDLEAFTWRALEQEADRMGLSVEELVRFSVAYYLADCDSGRIARQLPARGALVADGSPREDPLQKLLRE